MKTCALIAFILTACFSIGILSSIVTQEMKTINTLEELIDSNMTITTGIYTLLYWVLKSGNYGQQIEQMAPKLKFIDDKNSTVTIF